MIKPDFRLCKNPGAKTKAQISLAVNAKLISTFVFATLIVQPVFFLNLPPVSAQASLFETWLETPKTGFLVSLLKCFFLPFSSLFAWFDPV